MDDDYKIEMSPLSREVSRDGATVKIFIYRGEKETPDWILEVVDEEGASTVWDDPFPSDQAALDEAMLTIDEEGISTFLDPPAETLH